MKKVISLLLASSLLAILIVPAISQALSVDEIKSANRVIHAIKNKYRNIKINNKFNLKGYLYNTKGKVMIKDGLKVTKKLLIKGTSVFQKAVEMRSDLTVDGTISASNFNISDNVSNVDTSALAGGEVYYNQNDNKLYVYNSSSWLDLTQQDTDTDTDTTYTAGDNITIANGVISGIASTYTAGDNVSIASGVISATDTNTTYTGGDGITLTGTEFSADLGDSITTDEITANTITADDFAVDSVTSEVIADGDIVNADVNGSAGITYGKLAFSNNIDAEDLATDAVGASELSDSAIQFGDIGVGDLPAISSSTLSDVASIAMLDESETVTEQWLFSNSPDFGGANIIFLDTTDNIDLAIANATAGDTFILGAGDYTITDDIDIDKSISIIGQGKDITNIITTTDDKNVFDITASDVSIQKLSIIINASETKGIYIDGSAGTVLDDININNIEITLADHIGAQRGIYSTNASSEIRNVTINASSSDGNSEGIVAITDSDTEAELTVKCYNVDIRAVGGGTNNYGIRSHDSTSDQNILLSIYNSYIYSNNGTNNYGVFAYEDSSYIYMNNSIVYGGDYDVFNSSGALLQLTEVSLLNGTTNGVISYAGEQTVKLPVTLNTTATVSLTAQDCLNGLFINNDNDVIDYTLPSAQAGLKATFGNSLYTNVITVDAAAGDIIILNDGTALDAGDAIDSSGAIDDKGTLIAIDDTNWILWDEQNVWVDGGVD